MTQLSDQFYDWDGLNRQIRHQAPSLDWKYLYDGGNERLVKIPISGTGLIYTLRDEQNRIATEYLDAGVQRDNVYLGGLLVGSYAQCAPGWLYYSSDHLGTPRLVSNPLAQTIETRKYHPFGEEATSPPTGQLVRFASMERDVEASRYYDHARNHDFALGRFLSVDPVVDMKIALKSPQGWNRYAYVRNNPVNRTDPTGRCEDPGKGEGGKRICIQNFIPTKEFGIFRGDNRAARSDGGTFRTSQTFTLTKGGHEAAKQKFEPGISKSGKLERKAVVAKQEVKGIPEGVNVQVKASDGLAFGAAPNISYNLTLKPTADGGVRVGGTHSGYPALEVWMYQDGQEPQLLYNYDPQAKGFFGGTAAIRKTVTIREDEP